MNHFVIEPGFGLIPGAPKEANTAAFMTLLSDSYEGDWARARMHEVLNTQRTEFQAHDLELGFSYAGPAVVPDGTEPPPRAPMGDVYTPTTRPGHRLPHAWLERDAKKLSTHDLCGRGRFVLLTGSAGAAAWKAAAADAGEALGLDVRTVAIGDNGDCADSDGTWAKLCGIEGDGAILVRPDLHIGWRTAGAVQTPPEELTAALRQILAL